MEVHPLSSRIVQHRLSGANFGFHYSSAGSRTSSSSTFVQSSKPKDSVAGWRNISFLKENFKRAELRSVVIHNEFWEIEKTMPFVFLVIWGWKYQTGVIIHRQLLEPTCGWHRQRQRQSLPVVVVVVSKVLLLVEAPQELGKRFRVDIFRHLSQEEPVLVLQTVLSN